MDGPAGKVPMSTASKAASEPTSEEDLASVLPEEPELFIRLLYEDYKRKIAACIGKASNGFLNAGEIADVIQETMLATWERITSPGFKPKRPLRMVFAIARNKAVDACRRKGRFAANESDVTDFIIEDMVGTKLAFECQLADEEERMRLLDLLPDIIADLPPQQRLAVIAFRECYEEIRKKDKYRPVAEVMSRLLGISVDTVAAKSALNAGLDKVRRELVRRGIRFVERRGK